MLIFPLCWQPEKNVGIQAQNRFQILILCTFKSPLPSKILPPPEERSLIGRLDENEKKNKKNILTRDFLSLSIPKQTATAEPRREEHRRALE